jgi:hypothetical protein
VITDQMQERRIADYITCTEYGMPIPSWVGLFDKDQVFGKVWDRMAIWVSAPWRNNHYDFVYTGMQCFVGNDAEQRFADAIAINDAL